MDICKDSPSAIGIPSGIESSINDQSTVAVNTESSRVEIQKEIMGGKVNEEEVGDCMEIMISPSTSVVLIIDFLCRKMCMR